MMFGFAKLVFTGLLIVGGLLGGMKCVPMSNQQCQHKISHKICWDRSMH